MPRSTTVWQDRSAATESDTLARPRRPPRWRPRLRQRGPLAAIGAARLPEQPEAARRPAGAQLEDLPAQSARRQYGAGAAWGLSPDNAGAVDARVAVSRGVRRSSPARVPESRQPRG